MKTFTRKQLSEAANEYRVDGNDCACLETAEMLEYAAALDQAARALAIKLDLCKPALDSLDVIGHVHGMDYAGPTYGEELTALKTLLASPTASPRSEPA